MVRPGAGPIVIVGSGPIGLFACLLIRLRRPDYRERLVVLERRSPTRVQVILIREPMASILEVIIQGLAPEDRRVVDEHYSRGVRYNEGNENYMISFQIGVLQQMLELVSQRMAIEFIKNASAIDVHNDAIGFASEGELVHIPCQLVIDASGGGFAFQSEDVRYDMQYESPMLHAPNATFHLETKNEAIWDMLATTPLFLQKEEIHDDKIGNPRIGYRAPLTRVLPFRRPGRMTTDVYIGSEIPNGWDPRDFMIQLLEKVLGRGADEIFNTLTVTSTFSIQNLGANSKCITRKGNVFIQRIGDALYEPHYLTGAGIKNAYEPLELLLRNDDIREPSAQEIDAANNKVLADVQTYWRETLDPLLSSRDI